MLGIGRKAFVGFEMNILPRMLFLSFQLSCCLASRWFPKIRKNPPKFKFFKVVFYQNSSQHKSYNENASCFSKHEFQMHQQFKIKFICVQVKHNSFLNANKNAHYAMLDMIHTFGSLHSPSVSNHGHITIQKMINN